MTEIFVCLISFQLPNFLGAGDDLILPLVILCIELIGAIAVLPSEGTYDGFVIYVQGDSVVVREFLRESTPVILLDFLQMAETVHYPVKLYVIKKEKASDISVRTERRGVDPHLVSHALQAVDQIRCAKAEPFLKDLIEWERERLFRLMRFGLHKEDLVEVKGDTHLSVVCMFSHLPTLPHGASSAGSA